MLHHPDRSSGGRTAALVPVLFMAVLFAGCFGGGGSDRPVVTDVVRIPGPWVFEPAAIQVVVGTTVTWTNDGGQPHTVTFADIDSDQTVAPGDTITFTFQTTGTFDYVCRFHPPDMTGRVVVGPADETAAGPGPGNEGTDHGGTTS